MRGEGRKSCLSCAQEYMCVFSADVIGDCLPIGQGQAGSSLLRTPLPQGGGKLRSMVFSGLSLQCSVMLVLKLGSETIKLLQLGSILI